MIRQTRQRDAIEAVFRSENRPLTLPELHELAGRQLPGIGLRTIYRQVGDMAQEGLLVGLDYPGQPLRYELTGGAHHSHFICRSCKRVYDLKVDVPDVEIEAPEGFAITGQETIFYGVCAECGGG